MTVEAPSGLAGAVGRVVDRVAERRWGEVETAARGGAGGAEGAGGVGGVDWARVGAEMDAEMDAGTGSEGVGFLFLPMHLDLIVRCEALVGGGTGSGAPCGRRGVLRAWGWAGWRAGAPTAAGGASSIVSARQTTTPGPGPGPVVPDSGPGPPASAVPTAASAVPTAAAAVPAGPGVAAAPPAGGVFRAGSWSRCG